ncbi:MULTISPECIES: TIGR03435 family protein [Acidobacteriaceae]|uniref:TIGR03435 family protein n=1 Tax=Acidobacteriaceae TaxID=204434 RepID=UPI00131C5DF2|nr:MULTISPECIES: TIGR03435 family protein [Acidobacteriaceae]MDW5266342.1 TIGR03435 family protein [Edaphobacter sp.]
MWANSTVRRNLHKTLFFFALCLSGFAPPNIIAQQNSAGQQLASPMSPMAADAHPSLEVATVKPADPNETGNFIVGGHRLVIEAQTVNDLISFAYAVHRKQIVDGPAWLGTESFDIDGQADLPGVANLHQVQEMLQKLLQDRFGLKLHRDKRDLSIYAIKVAKGGPKLAQSTENAYGLPTQSGHGQGGQQQRKFTNNSMSDFALGMQAYMDRPVIDETNLPGRYDFTLKWTPDNVPTNEPGAAPGIFTAIQEQLGLKLEATKGPADVLVIDHIERPSAN